MNITVKDLKARMDANDDQLVLIDVREPLEREEFNIGGHHVPLGDIMEAMNDLEEYKEKEVIMYCRSGRRSAMAQNILQQSGFQKVLNLEGGMLAWQEM